MIRLLRTFAVLLLAATPPLLSSATAQAQRAPGRIGGIVLDSASGRPLSDVQVSVTGTRFGGATNEAGRFAIFGVPAGTYTLDTRRVGYGVRRVPNVVLTESGAPDVEIRLTSIALSLEAVVTTGLVDPASGTRVPFTVGRVDAENAPVPASNAIETIQGKIAGVTVIPSGQPGSGTNILLRTPTSISKSTSPLIVVDGVIQSQAFDGSSADLESMDIESVEVVKGAAAASLFGSRAASGVISIRTRRGNGLAEGQTTITTRSEVGNNALSGKIHWAGTHYYLTNASGEYVNAAGTVVTRAARVPKPVASRFQDTPYRDPVFDQVDRFFNPGQFYKNSATVSQNAGRTNWLLSFVNSQEGGVVLNSGSYNQNDIRLNLDHRLRDNLKLSFSGYHSRSSRNNLYGDTFFDLINQAPDVDLRVPDPDGTSYIFQGDPTEGREENPLYVLSTEENTRRRSRTQGSVEMRFTPLQWLSFDSNVSYDRSDRRVNFFLDAGLKTEGFGTGGIGQITQTTGTTDALNAAVSANLLHKVGALTLRSTLRALMEREKNEVTEADGTNFTTPGVRSLSNAQNRLVSSSLEEVRSTGYAATAAADYRGKYIIDGLVRRDGSSLFGPEARWNLYNRVSGAYRMGAESWWPFAAITEFKLRASRGTAGGRPDFDDQFETFDFLAGGGIQKSTLGNRFLKPEHATETELGIDMIVKDRYSLQLSYAKNHVVDQLVQVPLAGFYGYTSQWQNAGTVDGNTIEATLEAQVIKRPTLSWRVGFVADRSRNRITEFNRSCFSTNTIGFRCAGETLGAMYGFNFLKSAGALPADAQARAAEFAPNSEGILVWVGPGNTPGDGEAKKLWGTSTTIGSGVYGWGMPITQRDASGNAAVVKIGDGNPDYHLGFSNNVTWKELSLYALMDMQVGGNVYNQTNQRMYQYGRSADVDQTGKAQADKKTVDYYVALYAANSPTDYFVEPGGYLKLREVSARYRLNSRLLGPLANFGARGLSLGVIGRNLLTFTDYKGYDPEVSSSARPTTIKLDSFGYPRYRTFTGSVQIEF
ncbi:MAG: SusC/RagA family TonB-linked outer membrane protein [Gemmatimonadaceae bacterium]